MATLFLILYLVFLAIGGGINALGGKRSATDSAIKNTKNDEIIGLDEIIMLDIIDNDDTGED